MQLAIGIERLPLESESSARGTGERAIYMDGRNNEGQVERNLVEAMKQIHEGSTLREHLSVGRQRRGGAFNWRSQVESIYLKAFPDARGPAL